MPDAVASDNKLGYDSNNNPVTGQNITILNPINVSFWQEISESRMRNTGIKLDNSAMQAVLSVENTGTSLLTVGEGYDFNHVIKNWQTINDWQNIRSFYSNMRENVQSYIGEPGYLSKQEVENGIYWDKGPFGAYYKYKNGIMLYEHQERLSEIQDGVSNTGERFVKANKEIEFEPVGYSSDGKIEYRADKSLNVDAKKAERQNRHYSLGEIVQAALLLYGLGPEVRLLGALGFGLNKLNAFFKGLGKAAPKEVESSFRFTQTTASKWFSKEGTFSGRTIGSVVNDLRTGVLKAADIPVEYIERDGIKLIVNTRSSLALRRAGIPESEWKLINKTGDALTEAKITERLARNELTQEGVDVIRITGSGKNASSLE